MFTGLVQAVGTVTSLEGSRLEVSCSDFADLADGESIAVNGCCLTVVNRALSFDLSEETLFRTNLGALAVGDAVNLERAVRIGDRLGGHLVQGHVDGRARLARVVELAESWVLTVQISQGRELIIEKGSVALDGISLTVVSPLDFEGYSEFEVHIIPHTWENTNLPTRAPGDEFNIEFDMIAKHIARLHSPLHSPS